MLVWFEDTDTRRCIINL